MSDTRRRARKALLTATGCRDIRPLVEQEDDGAII